MLSSKLEMFINNKFNKKNLYGVYFLQDDILVSKIVMRLYNKPNYLHNKIIKRRLFILRLTITYSKASLTSETHLFSHHQCV